MFFDFLYFKPSDNVMSVEPTILLMVRAFRLMRSLLREWMPFRRRHSRLQQLSP